MEILNEGSHKTVAQSECSQSKEREEKSLTIQSCPLRVSLKYKILNHLKKFKANKYCQKYL